MSNIQYFDVAKFRNGKDRVRFGVYVFFKKGKLSNIEGTYTHMLTKDKFAVSDTFEWARSSWEGDYCCKLYMKEIEKLFSLWDKIRNKKYDPKNDRNEVREVLNSLYETLISSN